MPASFRHIALLTVIAAIYFLAGKLGLHFFGLVHPSASAVWPPTGVAIAALLLFGYRFWPALFVGAFAVNVTTAGSLFTSLGIATGNTLEALVAFFLIHQWASGGEVFMRARDIFKFVLLAALLSTTISATIGVSSLAVGGFVLPADFASIWLTWWLGDAAGAILVTPVLMLWYQQPALRLPRRRMGELALVFVTVLISGIVIFFEPAFAPYPLAFLCLPPLLWAAFRFGTREAATAVILLSVMATWATSTGQGPFVMTTTNESLLVLQSFMAMCAMTVMPIAALVNEREAAFERERVARAEAEIANHAKDKFLALLSHELRNPLAAISVATAVLERVPEPPGGVGRWHKAIQRQTEHLTRMIDDLLDIARVASGKLVLRREPVELSAAVDRSLRALASTGISDQHRIRVDADRVWVDADPDRLHQIITNLITNAVKYTPSEGEIRITVSDADGDATLRVDDTGIGIAPELLPRVFDLFTQGQQGIDRAQGGLGVGLTLVQRLVDLHGGKVEAQSAGQKRGSTFVVRLRSIDAPAASRGRVRAIGNTPRKHRVLIVEDNADTRQALRFLLEMSGHEVHEAEDGDAGIEAAMRLRPDVALIDIGLPGADGYEVARQVRATNHRVRLVAVTGYGRDEDKLRARQAGFDDHVLKPVSADRLQALMDDASTG